MCEPCRSWLAGKPAVDPGVGTAGRQPIGERELEIVVAWLVHGTKAIAASELHVAESTVKTAIQRVRDKYSAVGRPAPTQVHLLIRMLEDGHLAADVVVRRDTPRDDTEPPVRPTVR